MERDRLLTKADLIQLWTLRDDLYARSNRHLDERMIAVIRAWRHREALDVLPPGDAEAMAARADMWTPRVVSF